MDRGLVGVNVILTRLFEEYYRLSEEHNERHGDYLALSNRNISIAKLKSGKVYRPHIGKILGISKLKTGRSRRHQW